MRMEVKPFKAFRYDEAVVGTVGNCIAPPYDVISPDQQQQLYEKSEYNIVRIIKGQITATDNGTDNQYTRASRFLNEWISQGILKQDSADTIYAYVQNFLTNGQKFERLSFIALAKLEEFGKIVMPHEQIFTETTTDRLNLKRATSAKFGLPLMLYEDKEGIADKIIAKSTGQKPLIDFTDEQDVHHRLFAITAQEDIGAIAKMMHDKSCIIADGHHRYTTGLIYSKETDNPVAKYQMLAFCNSCHEGLVILGTHRLVSDLDDFNSERLITELSSNFEITQYPFDSPQTKADAKQQMLAQMRDKHCKDKNAFGIYLNDNAFYAAVLKDRKLMDTTAPGMSTAWRALDVAVLHKLILEKLLGIGDKELTAGRNVEYVKDNGRAVDEMVKKIDEGQKQAAFFMNPTKIQQIQKVAEAGERMPQKSTYFYPKVYTGLTISKM